MSSTRQVLLDRISKKLNISTLIRKTFAPTLKNIPSAIKTKTTITLFNKAIANAVKFNMAYNYSALSDHELQGYLRFLSTPGARKITALLAHIQLNKLKEVHYAPN